MSYEEGCNVRRVLITTTINDPVVLTSNWAEMLDPENDVVIVAGDHKTPHDAVKRRLSEMDVTTVYLHPDDVSEFATSAAVGFNCIQRRNLALLEALKYNPNYIITVDDDNIPMTNGWIKYVDQLLIYRSHATPEVNTESKWYNPGSLCSPKVIHRGFPRQLGEPFEVNPYVIKDTPTRTTGVFSSLWVGAPDIDAVERMHHDPEVKHVEITTVTLGKGTWSPFNTQATAFRAELAPLMFMWPHVGRFDDIWASYVTQCVMDALDWSASFGYPLVRQNRNLHDIVKDLEAELFGYRHNISVINVLRDLTKSFKPGWSTIECAKFIFTQLEIHLTNILPMKTITAFMAWMQDIRRIDEKYVIPRAVIKNWSK